MQISYSSVLPRINQPQHQNPKVNIYKQENVAPGRPNSGSQTAKISWSHSLSNKWSTALCNMCTRQQLDDSKWIDEIFSSHLSNLIADNNEHLPTLPKLNVRWPPSTPSNRERRGKYHSLNNNVYLPIRKKHAQTRSNLHMYDAKETWIIIIVLFLSRKMPGHAVRVFRTCNHSHTGKYRRRIR